MEFRGFVEESYTAQSPVSSNQALVNMYVQAIERDGGTGKFELCPTPGVQPFCTFTTAGGATLGGRAAIESEGRVFVIVGNRFHEVFGNGTSVVRGPVAEDANPGTIVADGSGALCLTSGGNVYHYDLVTNTLTLVLSGGYLMVGFSFGAFLAFDAVNRRVRISDPFDGLTWDPLEFFERSAQADPWQAMLVDPYGYVMLPGDKTGESWFPNGAASVPFELDKSSMIEEGIAAPFSLQQAGKSKVWLSTNKNGGYQVMRATGFTPARISDHALEDAIAGYGDVSNAIGGTYESKGHAFYQLTFPAVPITWEFNFTTNKWHQRGTWISEEGRFTYWHLVQQCFGFSRHLALDRESGVLYHVSDHFYVDVDDAAGNPRPLRRLRRSPAVTDEDREVFHDNFRLLAHRGVGVPFGLPEDMNPLIMMRFSDDFGQTWSPEWSATLGVSGQRGIPIEWWGLGQATGRVYEVTFTAGVPFFVTNAFLKVRRSRQAA